MLLGALLGLRPLLILSLPFGSLRLTLALPLAFVTFAVPLRLSLACTTLRHCGIALLLLPRLDALGFALLMTLLGLLLRTVLIVVTFDGLETRRLGLLTPAFLFLLELALFVAGMLTAFFLALLVFLALELLALFLCRLLRLFVAGHVL